MPQLCLTKQFSFEMAHALYNHDGHCKHIHGHSYKLSITIKGDVKNEAGHPNDGMVIDFGVLKNLIIKSIIDIFDHALVINKNAPYTTFPKDDIFAKTIYVPFQPTCENLVLHFVDIIKPQLPHSIELCRLKLHETETSFAEWIK